MNKCATPLFAIGIGLMWMMACGGRSQGEGGGAAGGQNSAGSAGIGNGGGAASGGAAGDPACSLPKVTGPCDASVPSFWHNPQTGLCEPFIYGGCQGNANRFPTRDACIAQCGSSPSDNWGSCDHDSDCTIVSNGCCEACEPVQDQQLLTISLKHLGDRQNVLCPSAGACAPCPTATEYDQTRKYFKPVCTSHQCSLIDVRESPLTECKSDAECMLRNGVNCCTECDASGFVPVNKNADFCDGQPEPCPQCASIIPSQYRAECDKGVCAFTLPSR